MGVSLPATMRAAVYEAPGRLEVTERPVPLLDPSDVLIEVSHCGVCGSDLHMVMEGWSRPGWIGGHEYSGRVVATGDEVEGWHVGDAVVCGPDISCGSCDYCRAGRPVLCTQRTPPAGGNHQGAFATYVRAHASSLLRVPPELELRTAALTEPLAVALHGITLSGVRSGQRALVTGAGPIGLLTIAALRAQGIDDIKVSEPGERRRRLALEVGATSAVTPDQLQQPTFPTTLPDEPVHVVFECAGRAEALEAGLCQLLPSGTLVIVGAGVTRPRWDPNRILLNELVITGAYCYDEGGCPRALELLASGRLPTELLIEEADVPLSGLQRAMEQLLAGELAGKVMTVPEKQ